MVTINISGDNYPRRRRRQYRRPRFRRSYGRSFAKASTPSTTPDTGYVPSGGGLAWNPINFPDTWAPIGNLPSGIHEIGAAALFEE